MLFHEAVTKSTLRFSQAQAAPILGTHTRTHTGLRVHMQSSTPRGPWDGEMWALYASVRSERRPQSLGLPATRSRVPTPWGPSLKVEGGCERRVLEGSWEGEEQGASPGATPSSGPIQGYTQEGRVRLAPGLLQGRLRVRLLKTETYYGPGTVPGSGEDKGPWRQNPNSETI